MSALQAALLLVGLTALATGLMIGSVITRKLRRDRREWISRFGRDRVRDAVLAGDGDVIRQAAARACDEGLAQVDFAVALDGLTADLTPDARAALDEAVCELGLHDALVAQLRSRNPVDRGRAILLLGELGLPEAEDELPALLSDPDPDVRLAACAELSRLGSRPAADALIVALTAEKLPAERIIERLGERWAVPALIDALSTEDLGEPPTPSPEAGPDWRAHLARAIGVAADPRAEPLLIAMLESPATEERVAAARALASSGTALCMEPLIVALDDPAWEVRAQAAKSLGRRGDERAVPQLERSLGHEAWWVRSNAADALAEIGSAGVEALKRTLSDPDRFARDRAREALALHHLVEA